MNTPPKNTFKTTVMFSLTVFVILILTMAVMGVVTVLLLHFQILSVRNPVMLVINFGVVSIVVGTVFSGIVGKRFLAPIVAISEATKKVAKGDFDIVLGENSRAEEPRVMAHNFNIMTRELRHNELLRNDFVENVSHEFKTPLSAVEGYTTLLQKPGLSEEKRMEYTERILYNTKRLSSLTGNILILSRLENQETELKKELFSLDEQLRETILMLEAEWNRKRLELDIDIEDVDFVGNCELLAQVWQNLIGNAIKFSGDGGLVRIYLKKATEEISVSIADNGIGMDEETTQRVFEKFYQGDASHHTEGNGLGLTLAKKIIDFHGGTITVSSKAGHGTTFTVLLPCASNSIVRHQSTP